MKNLMRLTLTVLIILSTFLLLSCSQKSDINDPLTPDNACFVQLFDGDNYTDDNITIKEPGEYSTLKNLPGADKNWNDEADSFKSGKNTTVTFWTKEDFKGDSVTYTGGTEKPSINEPASMKITCNE